MTYNVIVKLLGKIEYKGIFSLDNGKINIETSIDKNDYESAFWQMIKEGYTEIKPEYTYNEILKLRKNGGYDKLKKAYDPELSHIDFKNDLERIFQKIKEFGIDIEYKKMDCNQKRSLIEKEELRCKLNRSINRRKRQYRKRKVSLELVAIKLYDNDELDEDEITRTEQVVKKYHGKDIDTTKANPRHARQRNTLIARNKIRLIIIICKLYQDREQELEKDEIELLNHIKNGTQNNIGHSTHYTGRRTGIKKKR